jgi:hypothetical protein
MYALICTALRGLNIQQIVCKYFIDAVESGKYGWFWECPNGKWIHSIPRRFS